MTDHPIPMRTETVAVQQAREKLEEQIQCFADEIRAWGCAVDAQLDPAIDALISACCDAQVQQQEDKKDHSAALLPADPSAAANTEPLPNGDKDG